MKPHKHAELIKAWADGVEIQYLFQDGTWGDTNKPLWLENEVYRIKPREFPKSSLTNKELYKVIWTGIDVDAWERNGNPMDWNSQSMTTLLEPYRRAADAAVKQYILDTEKV